eukprot:5415719-Alexandrium_andersonii.AAC.1
MAEHQGQAPADAIPIPAGNSQAEIDRCMVAVGTKVNLLGMNLWKCENMPVRGEGNYSANPGDLPEFWGIAPGD